MDPESVWTIYSILMKAPGRLGEYCRKDPNKWVPILEGFEYELKVLSPSSYSSFGETHRKVLYSTLKAMVTGR
jgi:hypothetical protein